jgi:hypothetical protein
MDIGENFEKFRKIFSSIWALVIDVWDAYSTFNYFWIKFSLWRNDNYQPNGQG